VPPISRAQLVDWCRVPAEELTEHPDRRIALRLCRDSAEMGRIMARELVDAITTAAAEGRRLRTIIPCGPSSWYAPFTELVNRERVSMAHVDVFHMDECLDWEGRALPLAHPYSFRGFMQRHFYDPVDAELRVPEAQRRWLEPATADRIAAELADEPAELVYGGWGQDGHVAYNQARRNPFSPLTVDELRRSSVRVQDNNVDTVIALGQRLLGGAFPLVPPMSVTLGLREILAARSIRLFSDTGAWKQTALRVALFGPVDVEYPMTLLQEHPDVLLTATLDTAEHPISRHPEWDFGTG